MAKQYTEEDLLVLKARSAERVKSELLFKSARFNPEKRALEIQFGGDVSISVPIQAFHALVETSIDQLRSVQVIDQGRLLEWPGLNLLMTSIEVVETSFRVRTVQGAGSRGGSERSEAKASSARRNGALGGRPKKITTA